MELGFQMTTQHHLLATEAVYKQKTRLLKMKNEIFISC